MGDELKDAAIVVFSLAMLTGLARHRGEHAITWDLSRTLKGGHIETSIQPRGLLGILAGESSVTTIKGRGFTADDLPFRLTPGGGVRARVNRLRLDFRDFTLRRLPFRRLSAEIPGVSLDAKSALFNDRIVIRRAGEGTAVAEVDAAGLRAFLARKFPQFRDVDVSLAPGVVHLSATVSLLGTSSRVEAVGRLAPRDGRHVDVSDAAMKINGKEAAPGFVQTVLRNLNPIVDADKDLGLGAYVFVTDVEVGEGIVTLRGQAHLPGSEGKR